MFKKKLITWADTEQQADECLSTTAPPNDRTATQESQIDRQMSDLTAHFEE